MSKSKSKRTELGRSLAKLRIDFDETGAEMATKLGISPSQMFNVEVGIATVGYGFIAKIKKVYDLDLSDILNRGGGMSKVTIDLNDLTPGDKDIVLSIWSKVNEVEFSKNSLVTVLPGEQATIEIDVEVLSEDSAEAVAEAEVAEAVASAEGDASQWVEKNPEVPVEKNPLTGRPRTPRSKKAAAKGQTDVGWMDEDDD